VLTEAEQARITGVALPVAVQALATPQPAVASQDRPAVTVYGTILWSSFLNTALTNISDVPLFAGKQGSDASGNDKNFGMTVRQSRLGVRFQGARLAGARLSAHLEGDLFGGIAALPNGVSMDLFRLRLAYGRMDWNRASLVAGQDWSVFAPLNPMSLASFAIPAMAGSGNPWIRTPQVRAELRRPLSDVSQVLWQFALLDPNTGDYGADFRTVRTPSIGERGRLPGLDSRLSWTTRWAGREAALGLSSHYSRGKNAGLLGSRTVQQGVDSWGVALDYSVPLYRRVTLSGEVFGGRALGIFSASLGQAVLPVGTAGAHGVETRGGWTQAQFQVAARWQLNLAYGLESPDAAELRTGDRSRNQAWMSNVIYRLSPQFTVAWEWRRLLTDFLNQRALNERGDHFNLGVAYAF
jgi:hypothetical protein